MSANGRRVMAILVARSARRRISGYLGIAEIGDAVAITSRTPTLPPKRAFTLTTLRDNAHLVKHAAGLIGYAYLPSGVVRQMGDDIAGEIGAHGQSCFFCRRFVGQDDRKIGRRQSAVPNTE